MSLPRFNSFARTATIALLAIIASLSLASTAAAGTTSYTYDALGRVATAVYPNGTTVVYHYDSAGNRTQSVQAPTTVWGGFTWGSAPWG
jgi:YD repeat-containing protein